MPINFPDSPVIGETFSTPAGRTWEWDGARWVVAVGDIQTFVSEGLANIIDSAPTALDTLNELAAALADDPNFAATITNQLGTLESEIDTKVSMGKAIAAAIVFG